jgi:hypothetical protein
MEEDVLGTRQEGQRNRYVQCTRCQRWVPHERATLISPEEAITTDEDSPSEEMFICSDCKSKMTEEDTD